MIRCVATGSNSIAQGTLGRQWDAFAEIHDGNTTHTGKLIEQHRPKNSQCALSAAPTSPVVCTTHQPATGGFSGDRT